MELLTTDESLFIRKLIAKEDRKSIMLSNSEFDERRILINKIVDLTKCE